MRKFYVADLNAQGELLALEGYRYEKLEQVPGAGELIVTFATHVWRSPEQFEEALRQQPDITVRWRNSSDSTGILTVRCRGELASLSLLVSGIDDDADRITLEAFQTRLLRELHGTATEPAFALLELWQRPLVATVNFISPPEPADRMIVALADRCFAAAYFRTHNLA